MDGFKIQTPATSGRVCRISQVGRRAIATRTKNPPDISNQPHRVQQTGPTANLPVAMCMGTAGAECVSASGALVLSAVDAGQGDPGV